MIVLPGYRQLEEVMTTPRSAVLRGWRVEDGVAVIVKRLKRAEPGSPDALRYQREFGILRHLAEIDGAVTAHDLAWNGHSLALALEDFGGISLRQAAPGLGGDLGGDLGLLIDLAIRATEILGQIHSAGVIHNAVSPDHLCCNLDTGDLRLVGFGDATLLSQENPAPFPIGVRNTGLHYIAPEQTGRTNRKVDYRSDYYSLGATFYQLFSGSPPFVSDDPMELVYAHLAKAPLPLDEVVPGFPAPLAEIVGKLLAKDSKHRYQSAWGIVADLRECARSLTENGRITPFPLASEDISEQFRIAEKLYGRESEIESLFQSYRRAAEGGREVMLIAGYSGVGKTSLVREIYKPLARQKGFLVSGKFEQFQRNIPYSAFISAFADLVRQLLTGSEQRLSSWRQILLNALGSHGQLVIDVLPEVELIVGPQPAVSRLPPSESKNRFNRVFLEFIHCFHKPAHPLVIFIDDLQWADTDSLNLVDMLMSDPATGYLLFIGAYRDNEIGADHPLTASLDSLHRKLGGFEEVILAPLALNSIQALLEDALHAPPQDVLPLADLVFRKTGGNPFFVSQFVTTLHDDGLLKFDAGARCWQWDLATIKGRDFTDNVVDLVISKLMRLPESSRETLQLAACIGNRFDLQTLATIRQRSPGHTSDLLLPAIQQGLVLTGTPLAQNGKSLEQTEQGLGDTGPHEAEIPPLCVFDFTFLHDRVQQAAYALIDDGSKQDVHLQIARLLKDDLNDQSPPARLFELADHFNKGIGLVTDPAEKLALVELNLTACHRTKASAAYDAALRYITRAMDICPTDAPRSLMFRLHRERADLEYLNGRYDVSPYFLDQALTLAETDIERAETLDLRIVQENMLGHHAAAIATGREALALLGITLPVSDLQAALGAELDAAETALGGRDIASLADAPEMSLADKKAAMIVLNDLTPAAYFHQTDLYSWILAKMANLSLTYGNAPESGKGYTSFGNVLVHERSAFQAGYAFGMVGLELSRNINHHAFVCRSCFVATAFLMHWVRPISESDALAEEGYRAGLESGEFLYVGYILAFHNVMNGFFSGRNLAEMESEMVRRLPFIRQTNNRLALDLLTVFQQAIAALSGRNGKDGLREFINTGAEHWENPDIAPSVTGTWLILQSILLLLTDRPAEAMALHDKIKTRESFLSGTTASAAHKFYRALVVAGWLSSQDLSADERHSGWARLKADYGLLCVWAESSPHNFEHKRLLVAAEMARLSNQTGDAIELYDRAIAGATQSGFVSEEALANELAARFWLARGKPDFARLYLAAAIQGWRAWGARAKVDHLEKLHGAILDKNPEDARAGLPGYDDADNRPITGRAAGEDLDFSAALKAAQAISGEIELGALLGKVMGVVMEIAGAEKGGLLLRTNGRLVLAALSQDGKVTFPDTPTEDCEALPLSVVYYVMRTRNEAILDDAGADPLFSGDPYIKQRSTRSVFCIPILGRGEMSGILYLENDQAAGAFTSDRIDLLRMISGQAAISLTNARYYESLRASEEKFRLLYENALEGLFECDSSGRIQYANPAMAQCLGYDDPPQLLASLQNAGNSWFADPERRRAFLQAVATSDQVADFEAQFRRRDGSEIWISISAQAVFDSAGRVQRIAGFLLDIGARKEKEAAERERREAEAATQAKSQFLANMSHEIRTPMNAIIGLTQLALRTEMSPKQIDYLRKIRGSSQNLLGIINDILDFSKIEAGKLDLERIPFDLRDVMDNLTSVIAIKSEEKDLEILLSVARNVPQHLIGDPLRLGQVLINLASNAIKFTDRGEVVISTMLGERSEDGARLKFSVRDTGIGMSDEQQAHLFKSFHQADGSVTRKYGGTGLGLAISKQLVEMMDGTLAVESEQGLGSTFSFDAQFALSTETEAANLLMPAALSGKTVLVVDDNHTAREIMNHMLEAFSVEVILADSGEAALTVIADRAGESKKPFDLVLMDWNMPGMNGIETARCIKNHAAGADLPAILMVTAYGRDEVMKAAEDAGLDGFLVKPVGQSLLYNTILETFGLETFGENETSSPPEGLAARLAPGNSAQNLDKIRGARVLVVEDNPINQQVAVEFLLQAGLDVDIANNGLEGLQKAESGFYDLVLMDVQMPEMDGLEATRRIRAQARFDGLPVIAMTAHAMASDREKSLQAGMNAHLTKPIDAEELINVMIRWIPATNRLAEPRIAPAPSAGGAQAIVLPEIDGLDTVLGLKLVGGSRRLYVELLHEFTLRQCDAAEVIRDAIARDKPSEAGRMAHTIKGSAGSLGAEPLSEIAHLLEKALRDADSKAIAQHLPIFARTIAVLCRGLRGYFAAHPPAIDHHSDAVLDIAQASHILRDLRACLQAGDTESEDHLAALHKVVLGLEWESSMNRILDCIEDVEFDAALAIVDRLTAELAKVAQS